jgi:putative CocE/NonD family hydrolase
VKLLLLAIAVTFPAAALEKQLHLKIPMRDGVGLCTHVFRPTGTARVPTILLRTPYRKPEDITPAYRYYVERGYAVVLQDVRGRYDSGGVFAPLTQEGPDGEDTLNWIANQPWSDGGVGMMGGSYLGMAQWRLAVLNNPHLKAISPVVAGWDDYRDRFYSRGGAFKLGHRLLWLSENLRVPGAPPQLFDKFVRHVPLETSDLAATGRVLPAFRLALDHPSYDAYWKDLSVRERIDRVRVPALITGGWYDNYAQGDLEAFAALRSRNRDARVLIGPWPHDMSQRFPGADYGNDSMAPVGTMQLEWFDHYLQGKPLAPRAAARIFVMGSNRWRDEDQWPPARTVYRSLYLAPKGGLTERPSPKSSADRYTYDPRDPVPTAGGSVCCNPKIFAWGPMDQRNVEKRPDVLTYTGPVLKRNLDVIGVVRVVLHVATSAPDTDFTAKLVDVYPDGTARNITDGILRLRYRSSLETPVLAQPDTTYRITIDAGVTANTFLIGHRIRLEISSSNFPRFDRNPNTGRPVAKEADFRIAEQTVRYGVSYPSHLELPVLATDSRTAAGARPLSR